MFLNSNNDEKQNPQQNLQTNYPNDDYLYNKITSLQTKDKLKIYICAITVNTNLETHFVKYIVQHNNSNVSLPFFIFESQSNLPFEQHHTHAALFLHRNRTNTSNHRPRINTRRLHRRSVVRRR